MNSRKLVQLGTLVVLGVVICVAWWSAVAATTAVAALGAGVPRTSAAIPNRIEQPDIRPAQPLPGRERARPQGETAAAPRTFAGANGRIAFISARDGNNEVYTMLPDGSDQTRLTFTAAAEYEPAWSPDGRQIVFRSGRDGNDEIYSMNADGSHEVRLTTDAAVDMSPAWSYDGTQIVFVSDRDGNRDIFVMDADGANPVNLTNSPEAEYGPEWDPLNYYIAYERNNSGYVGVYLMELDGDNPYPLYGGVPGPDYVLTGEPSWSPDGLWLAATATLGGNQEIIALDFWGNPPLNLSNTPFPDYQPSWSPDGTAITFASDRDGNSEIYSMNADGGGQTRLTTAGATDYQPAWGPFVPDEDADGIAGSVEDGAPNGGDGNDDGLPDSQQANVASLPNGEDGTYLTLVELGGAQLVGVAAVGNPSPDDAPAGVAFPLGHLSYSIEGLPIGGGATVQLIRADTSKTIDTFYKFGPTPDNPTPHWYEFLDDGLTGLDIAGDALTLFFVDGERGDADLQADGTIVDPGGPARKPLPVCKSVSAVAISGDAQVPVNQQVVLTAEVEPSDATAPITYTWYPDPVTGQGTAVATFSWPSAGAKKVELEAENCASGYAYNEKNITVEASLPTVKVVDENGQPLEGALVYHNGAPAGATNAAGLRSIPGLATGDALAARWTVYEAATASVPHDGWRYRVYRTSLDIPRFGEPQPLTVTDPANVPNLVVKAGNVLVGLHLVVSVSWDATTPYLSELQQGLAAAAKEIYDATDGQVILEDVEIYDLGTHYKDADLGLVTGLGGAGTVSRANVRVGSPPEYGFARYEFGPTWDGDPASTASWASFNGARELARGIAAYAFELHPSTYYIDALGQRIDGIFCTSAAIATNNQADTNASLMSYPAGATEFAMYNVPGLWSAGCMQTRQWQFYEMSDWETIVLALRDLQQPARWTLRTPAVWNGVVAGPHVIPVAAWTNVGVAANADTGVCLVPPQVRVLPPSRSPVQVPAPPVAARGMVPVSGNRGSWYEQYLNLGRTNSQGDMVAWGVHPSETINFVAETIATAIAGTPTPTVTRVGVAVATVPANCGGGRGATAEPIEVQLELAGFTPELAVTPGDGPNQARITLTSSHPLDTAPTVTLTQTGAPETVEVPMSALGPSSYSGQITLNIAYEASGLATATAVSDGETVTTFVNFLLATVAADADETITSADGRAELFLPAGALSAAGRVSITVAAPPGPALGGLQVVGGPYAVVAEGGVGLQGAANLSLRYESAGALWPDSAALYRWNGAAWVALAGSGSAGLASAPIETFGTYAVLAKSLHVLYAPAIRR